MPPNDPQSNIMIVDDNPANLQLLEDMLAQEGHQVSSFPLGMLALAAAVNNPPDLILLDINMPELNGYEVCERLKSNEALSGIPVIFLSALNETQDKVKAFQCGAVDYISKPFQFEEVHSRVETHLKLHELRVALAQQNEHLEETVAARTRELAGANESLADANARLTILDHSKSEFLKLISHEFRTPLNGLLGVGDLILEGMPATEENRELQGLFERSRLRILSIMDDALLLTQIDVDGEKFRPGPVSLSVALRGAVARTAELAESRQVKLAAPAADLDFVLGNEYLLIRAFHALLETAVRFSEKGERVRLTHEAAGDSLKVVIESHGKTIPSTALPKFFDIFSIGESMTPGGDHGLGPAMAHRIVSLFGASVSVENTAGIRLTVSLRRAPASG